MQIARLRSRGLVQAVILLSAVSLAVGQVKPAPKSQAQSRLARAAARVHREGLHATLPPHLSTLLGLTKEQECPVMQGVLRTGKMVQGFDVSVDDENDIVLFVVDDEAVNDQTLYLTSAQGKLRKVVSVKNGVGSVSKISDENKKAFEKEKEFWLGRLGQPQAAK